MQQETPFSSFPHSQKHNTSRSLCIHFHTKWASGALLWKNWQEADGIKGNISGNPKIYRSTLAMAKNHAFATGGCSRKRRI